MSHLFVQDAELYYLCIQHTLCIVHTYICMYGNPSLKNYPGQSRGATNNYCQMLDFISFLTFVLWQA